MNEQVSEIVVEQRIRNNLIQYFELACDEVALLDYQRDVPIADVLGELINQFEDSFDIDHLKNDWYKAPVYTQEEIDACIAFHEIWDMVDFLPEHIKTIGDFLSSNYWPPFKNEAARTLMVFMRRGYLSNDVPEFNKQQPTSGN